MGKDIILIGAIIGILADILKLSVNYISYLLNYTNVVFWQITASRFLERDDLQQPISYIIGGVADLTVSATLGVLFVGLISLTGTKHIWIKGIGFGLFIWVNLFGTLLGQSVQAKLPQEPLGIMVTIIAHFAFGLGLAFFTQRLHKIEEETIRSKETNNHFAPIPARKLLHTEEKEPVMEINNTRSDRKPFKFRNLFKIFGLIKGNR
ncbi:DUF6789 family protein [Desulfallas thermosapovorans]|uniref:Uncharacterized protein n=1 Tax=Desulfallas thermosapovorans DSM 6562 TaxID=1121431 RepID=A0A5S4ZWG3_9FIRM|nr:DUF6789 family protein [Desulfallas thermosapovorans]TYO97286.1 hypothetical protein LX24_00477 [Desulfallas thermosapovorans DSM 6562]